jgi:hypothetical protein
MNRKETKPRGFRQLQSAKAGFHLYGTKFARLLEIGMPEQEWLLHPTAKSTSGANPCCIYLLLTAISQPSE